VAFRHSSSTRRMPSRSEVVNWNICTKLIWSLPSISCVP
jgi:hypothetical protein